MLWSVIGYSLVYGNSLGGFIGDLDYFFMRSLKNFVSKCNGQFGEKKCIKDEMYWESCGIPEFVFFFFQNKFATITPAILIGSISERMLMKYSILFILLWSIFIYCPIAHWIWNEDGFLKVLGAIDYAGGFVVHISSGFSALVTSLYLGRRKGYGRGPEVTNFPYVILGVSMLWFGWFGFNGGSSLSINSVAITSVINTNISASFGLVVWLCIDLIVYKKITALGVAMGCMSGLIVITPCAGYVETWVSFVLGFTSGILSWIAIYLRKKYSFYDDLDVFSCHGICGIYGVLAAGLFSTTEINPFLRLNGLFYSYGKENEDQSLFIVEIISIFVVALYSGIGTFLILFSMSKCFKLRAKINDEIYYDVINFFDKNKMMRENEEVVR